ncbi:hypothetical protein NP493_1276g00013 [Ridgeia piscesae]|uniref:Uncharacterized protein n=1 Tax=Ridgeia piscesae TaxID=27915 RepID=A0AAD9NEK0_RIDPI|nr:hypothetical protein NP493_1276g00013 [Ridgeia piscesae]
MRRISTPSNTSKHYASTGSTKLSSNHRVLPPSPIGHTTNYGTDRYPARRVMPKTDARSTSRKPMKCDHSVQMTKVHSPNTSSLGTYGTTPRLSRKDRTNSYSELNQITADLHHTTLSDAPDVSLRRSKKYSSSYDVTSSSSSCSSADRSRTTPNGVGTQNYDETNDSLPDIQPPRSLRPSSMDRSQRSSSTDHYYGSAGTASKAVLDGGARVQQGSSSLAYQTENYNGRATDSRANVSDGNSRKGLVGLRNLGNTVCTLRSQPFKGILQSVRDSHNLLTSV